jgi:plasmid maintenance system antidote protein VapI
MRKTFFVSRRARGRIDPTRRLTLSANHPYPPHHPGPKIFHEIIEALGFAKRGASHFLGVTERTMMRWIARDQIARPVAVVLELR